MSWLQELRASWQAERTAVVFEGEQVSFAELDARTARAGGWLRAHGVGQGDVLALQLPRSLAFLELHLAALGLGACTLPLNPGYTSGELQHMLTDARPRLAVLGDASAARRDGPLADLRIHSSRHLRAELDAAPPARLAPALPSQTPAVLLYTSGTTGRPKGALISHGNLAATVGALRAAWAFCQEDRLLHALPLFHVHGLFVAQHQALLAGATSLWMPRFDAREALASMERDQATVFMGVPTFYSRLLALPDDARPDLDTMRLFTSGSAPLPARDLVAFERRYGHRILERYGMTEVGIVLSNPLRGERRAGTVGLPLPGVTARILDAQGREVPDGTVGELTIAGASVFAGYLNLPEVSAEALRDGAMHTGDLATRDPDGYIRIVGRRTQMILSGGLNVYPAEVEAALLEHPGISQAAVLGVPDPDLGERVVASVVAEPDVDLGALREATRGRLAPYKVPKAIERVEALPRNALGKVQIGPLRARWQAVRPRPASIRDLDQIVSWNLAMAVETEGLELDRATLTRGVARVLRGEVPAHYVLAERAGEPVGQCMITREWSDWRDAEVWWFQSVYVAPSWRRRGVFRHLFDHVRREAARSGAAGLRLYVDQRNAAAQATYRNLGMSDEHYLLFELLQDGYLGTTDLRSEDA